MVIASPYGFLAPNLKKLQAIGDMDAGFVLYIVDQGPATEKWSWA
jgi:hypothetical protein